MSDILKTLSNIRSLRVIARETSLEQLESLLEKFLLLLKKTSSSTRARTRTS
ncbi:DNA-binding protein H-NS [Actinobacillus equuli]|nr:DNA-binding protein H-NS [Actinobacillus equuli]